jgi:hypothetical protein
MMDTPIDYTEQVLGTHQGGICAACGHLIDRDETRVQATIRTAAGTASAFLHHRCRFDTTWLPPSPREERRE